MFRCSVGWQSITLTANTIITNASRGFAPFCAGNFEFFAKFIGFGQHCRGRTCPARGSARPPFNGQLPLMLQAGHARPLPRGCHRLPRRGQDPSLRTIVHGCFVGSGLDRSAGWADVSGLARRGGIHVAREPCAAANIPGGINSSPTHCPQTIFCMTGRRGRRPLPPYFVCAQRKLHLFYYLLSFISYLFIICSIRGMIYLTPISITKRSDPF